MNQPQSPKKPNNCTVIGIVMTYNCAGMIAGTYERLDKAAYSRLILIDDGSTDGTADVARGLGIETYEHQHSGYGGNLKFGLQKALELNADYMVEIHGDGQYATTDVQQAITKMEVEKIDFLLGSRFARSMGQPLKDGISYSRYLANIGLSFFDRLILRLPLTEFHSGFRIYTRSLIETVGFQNTSNDYLYSFEIIAQAKYYGFKVAEIPVRCDYLEDHTSISIKKSTIYALQTFRVLGKYVISTYFRVPTGLFRKR